MRVLFMYPGEKFKALTFSFDDGVKQDVQLIDIFNRYNLKGTFNLNSGIPRFKELSKEEYRKIYEGHEVACHGEFHLTCDQIPRDLLTREVWRDREIFEDIFGGVITGLAYPNGSFSPRVMEILDACGIEYARTTVATGRIRNAPEDFLAWHPTCHYRDAMDLVDGFLNDQRPVKQLFYIWGHSYEFDRGVKDWQYMEDLAAKLANRDDIWYATNIEVCRYLKAVRSLKFSADGRKVYNPSCQTVWFRVGWEGVTGAHTVAPGETFELPEPPETL